MTTIRNTNHINRKCVHLWQMGDDSQLGCTWQGTLNDVVVASFTDRWEAKEHYQRLILALLE